MELNLSIRSAVALTELLVGIGVVINSIESLSAMREWAPGGLFDWVGVRAEFRVPQWLQSTVYALFRYPRIAVIFVVRGGAGLFLIIAFFAPTSIRLLGAVALVLFLTGVLFYLAHAFGHDGADQMLQIILGPLGIAQMIGNDSALLFAMLFIASQCLLSYATAGIAKLFGSLWRRGIALHLVLRTRGYGSASLAVFFRTHPVLEKVTSYTIVAYEVCFIVSLFLPPPWFYVWLTGGILLHLSFALFMGLNNFVWTFAATYPALMLANQFVRQTFR